MSLRSSINKTAVILSVLLCLQLSVPSACGWCMTTEETSQYITIPITEWNDWKNDWTILDSELTACKSELQKIKKPSSELLQQLSQAEKMLKLLQEELAKQNVDLTTLSKQAGESKTELKNLKEKINKERRVHKRQVWQNRIWCLLIGVGVGCAVK